MSRRVVVTTTGSSSQSKSLSDRFASFKKVPSSNARREGRKNQQAQVQQSARVTITNERRNLTGSSWRGRGVAGRGGAGFVGLNPGRGGGMPRGGWRGRRGGGMAVARGGGRGFGRGRGRGGVGGRGRGRGAAKPKVSAAELDAELDSYRTEANPKAVLDEDLDEYFAQKAENEDDGEQEKQSEKPVNVDVGTSKTEEN